MRKSMLSLGVIAAVAVGGVGAAAATSERGGDRVELTAVQTSSAEVPPAEGFLGLRVVGADELRKGTTPVGDAVRSCEVAALAGAGRATVQCVITLTLAKGTLTLQAMPTLTEQGLESVTAPVTGGTGAFRNARGEAFIEELGPTETRYSIDWR